MKILTNIWVLGTLALIVFAAPMLYIVATHEVPPPPETMYDKEVDGLAVAALWNTQTGQMEKLSQELDRRKRDLAARETELERRKERLENEMEELRRLQQDIAAKQQELDDMILSIEAAEVKNLRSQATVYSNMDAENTVKVFETLNDVEVAKVLYFMNPDVQSEIFAAMIETYPAPAEGQIATTQKNGPKWVARLNDLLKYAKPPEKQANNTGF